MVLDRLPGRDHGVTSGAHARLVRRSLRAVGVRTIVLLEYLVLAGAVAATVWARLDGYQPPATCVECYYPATVVFLGLLAMLLLCVAAVAALGIARAHERRRARRGLAPARGRGAIGAGTVVAAAGLLAAVLATVLFWAAAGLAGMLT